MKGKVIAALMAVFSFSMLATSAQTLRNTEWKAYGLQFKAPVGFAVEDDSDDEYIISTEVYYITIQLLDGDDLTQAELAGELKHVADDDEVQNQSTITSFELPQFYGVFLKGESESDRCLYAYLLDKGEGSGFYVSILYVEAKDTNPEAILKSFKLVE